MTTKSAVEATREFDVAYLTMMDSISNFFRYAKRHPDAQAKLNELFDEAYYLKVADVVKRKVDHEMKYLHSPYM